MNKKFIDRCYKQQKYKHFFCRVDPDYRPGNVFFTGRTKVIYVARSPEGLTDTCSFYITISRTICNILLLKIKLILMSQKSINLSYLRCNFVFCFWFDIRLEIKCTEPKIGKEVLMLCTHGDMRYGTECDFECRPGYSLVGMNMLMCSSKGQWTNSAPVCKGTDFLRYNLMLLLRLFPNFSTVSNITFV